MELSNMERGLLLTALQTLGREYYEAEKKTSDVAMKEWYSENIKRIVKLSDRILEGK